MTGIVLVLPLNKLEGFSSFEALESSECWNQSSSLEGLLACGHRSNGGLDM
jgi:hypothetical protein